MHINTASIYDTWKHILRFEFEFELRFRMRTHGSRPSVSQGQIADPVFLDSVAYVYMYVDFCVCPAEQLAYIYVCALYECGQLRGKTRIIGFRLENIVSILVLLIFQP